MKFGRTPQELYREIVRQRDSKLDYVLDTRVLHMDADENNTLINITNNKTGEVLILGVNEIAHNQIGTNLSIPSKYYDKMRAENPELLATNVNSWFEKEPKKRMVRTLDSTMRAFLSDRYHCIDNDKIAEAVLPIIFDMPEARIESCEITDQRMYIKVVNPKLTTEVVPGDIVQSGILITNSEVGMGSVTIQPLIYRLVCTNGMVVNDAKVRKYHVGKTTQTDEDFIIYSEETMLAEDQLLMMKIRDTMRSVVDSTRFEKVVDLMRSARNARITSNNIPAMVQLTGKDYGYTAKEGESILDYLIRGGDLSLYGMANAVTRAAQDVASYDRSTALESVGYDILSMGQREWNRLNAAEAVA